MIVIQNAGRVCNINVTSLSARLGCRSPAGLVLEIDVRQRVAVGVADDVAVLAELGIRVIDRPGWREAARLGHGVPKGGTLALKSKAASGYGAGSR